MDLFRERRLLWDSPALHLSPRPFQLRADCTEPNEGAARPHRDGQTERALTRRHGRTNLLVAEFDFARLTPKGKPSIWAPLLDRCEAAGITILDLNAAVIAHLALERPVWMTVYSGGKSLQMWTPCRGEPEEGPHDWFAKTARRLGACQSTWCKSQFVRMPDGTRAVNSEGKQVRQSIEFYNSAIL